MNRPGNYRKQIRNCFISGIDEKFTPTGHYSITYY